MPTRIPSEGRRPPAGPISQSISRSGRSIRRRSSRRITSGPTARSQPPRRAPLVSCPRLASAYPQACLSIWGCASNDNFCNLAKPFDAGEPSSRKWSTAFGQCHAAIQTHSIRTFCASLHNACPEVRVRSYDAKHICGRSASRYRPACAGVAISHRCPISQLPERPSRW